MTFKLTIELGNDAMRTKRDIHNALVDAARKVIATCSHSMDIGDGRAIMDINGSRVGSWEVVE